MLLDVLPTSPANHPAHRTATNGKQLGDSTGRHTALGERSNFSNVVVGELRTALLFSAGYAVFFDGILGIVFRCPKKQMIRIHAKAIVAAMTNKLPALQGLGRQVMGYFPRDTMDKHKGVPDADLGVSLSRANARPFVATVGHDADFTVEAGKVFRGILGLHVNLLNSCASEAGGAIPSLSLLYHRT